MSKWEEEWEEELPGEIRSRFMDVNLLKPTLEQAVEECRYVIEMINDGGCDYNDDPDEGRGLAAECRRFLRKYARRVRKER